MAVKTLFGQSSRLRCICFNLCEGFFSSKEKKTFPTGFDIMEEYSKDFGSVVLIRFLLKPASFNRFTDFYSTAVFLFYIIYILPGTRDTNIKKYFLFKI